MPNLTITVNTTQANRALLAFGHWDMEQIPKVWIPANTAEIQREIKAWVQTRVVEYEATLAAEQQRTTLATEVW